MVDDLGLVWYIIFKIKYNIVLELCFAFGLVCVD